jgi:hypothetical protein
VVRTGTTVEYVGDQVLEVTARLELDLVDDLYPGRYVMRELTILEREMPRPFEMPGLSPTTLRSIAYATIIAKVAHGAMRLVVVDPESRTVVDHLDPRDTLTDLNDVVVANWLSAKLCGLDPNKTVAAAMESDLTATAVAQRIKRLREAGVLLAPDQTGARR